MRTVISKVGVITPYGRGLDVLHRGLASGQRCFSRWQHDAVFAGYVVGQVDVERLAHVSRSTALALTAARDACADLGPAELSELAIIVGGTTGGMDATESCFLDPPYTGVSGFSIDIANGHAVSETADVLARELGASGPRTTLVSACSSGLNCVIMARQWLSRGWAKRVLAVGTDALCRLTMAGFSSLGAIDPDGTRPFQANRRGLTLSEGAAAFLIEDDTLAEQGGRQALAEIRGAAIVGEAFHATQPDPSGDGAWRVMTSALADAAIGPEQIDAISAHGTGTVQNDVMECAAVARLFGQRPLIASQKSQLGHALGAAGALELAAVVAMLTHQEVYATHGLTPENVDPACAAVSHVFGQPMPRRLRYILKNSFAFGGQNAALVLGAETR